MRSCGLSCGLLCEIWAHTWDHREGGKQDSLGSVKPQLLQSPGLGRAWCGPTHCTLLLFPAPQLTTCLTSMDGAHPQQKHPSEKAYSLFLREQRQGDTNRDRERLEMLKTPLGGKNHIYFQSKKNREVFKRNHNFDDLEKKILLSGRVK